MLKLFVSYALIIAFTGFYYPYFARPLELLLLLFTFKNYKIFGKRFFLITAIAFAFVSILYITYHNDRLSLAVLNVIYSVRTPILTIATYLVFKNVLANKKLLSFSLKIWLCFYIVLIFDLLFFIILGIQPVFAYGGSTLRVFGFADPNSFALFIWLTIIIARYYFQDIKRGKNTSQYKVVWLATAAILFFFTGSRGALVAAILALITEVLPFFKKLIFAQRLNKRYLYGIILISFFLLFQVLLLSLSNMNLLSYWRVLDATGGSHRLERWINAFLFMSRDNYSILFGLPMTAVEITETIGGWPHNSYVKIMLNQGLLYLLLYLLFMLAVFVKIRKVNLSANLTVFIVITSATNDFVTSPLIGFCLGVALAIFEKKMLPRSENI